MTRLGGAIAIFVACMGTVAARAQDGVAVATEPAESDPPAVSADARAHLDRGDQLFEAGGFDAALAEYQAAYAAMEGHPSRYLVLFNIAQCHERLSQYDLALEHYQRYLDEGGANEADAAQVRGRIDVLGGLLGTVAIAVTWPEDVPEEQRPAVDVWVGERRVGHAPGEIRVPGGNHAIEVRAPGFELRIESVTLAAGARVELAFEMRRISSGAGLHPAVFVGSTVAAGLALVAGASIGGYVLSRTDQLNALQGADQVLRTDAEIDTLQDLALVADIMYGTAALFGVAAIILYFATDWDGDAPPETAAASLRITPVASPTACGLVLEGAF